MLVSDTIELASKRVRDIVATRLDAPPPSSSLSEQGRPPAGAPVAPFGGKSPSQQVAQLSAPVWHRLTTTGPEGVSLEVPLQADRVSIPNIWVRTPETVQGFEFRLFIEMPSKRGDLRVKVEYAGLLVETALSYARFVLSLYSKEGILHFTVLEDNQLEFDVAELPLLSGDATRETLRSQIRLMEDLFTVGEATGEKFVYPSEMTGEDVLAARRTAEAVRTGWLTESVEELQVALTPEDARVLPLHEEAESPLEGAIAVESESESVRVFNREIHLGPSIRWIERARLETPMAHLQRWLATNPASDEGLETRWGPVGDHPMHIFFPDWPKRSTGSGSSSKLNSTGSPARG